MSIPEYEAWKADPSPENMATVLSALEPTINAEVQRYTGPKPLLRGKARLLAANAVKKYDPNMGAHLRSWVVTQMQPLSRYGQQMRPIHTSEMAIRQAAEINRIEKEMSDKIGRHPTHEELADETGISTMRIKKLKTQVKPTLSESYFTEADDEEGRALPGTQASDVLGNAEAIVYDSLSARDKMIYDWKIGRHGKAQVANQEIAKRLGVTPALISQRSQQIALQIQNMASKRTI